MGKRIPKKTELVKQHDPLVRKHLSDINIAREFLQIHLPAEIKSKLDINTIVIESGSYIDDDLKTNFADIVYRANLLDDKGTAYIYTLIEHQSLAEEQMPLRILRYQLAIIQQHIDRYGNKKSLLPMVIPLVFYNGKKSPYPHKCDIAEIFADSELYQRLPLGKFQVVDLTVIPEDEILHHRKLALLEMAIKHIHARNFFAIMDSIIKALQIVHEEKITNSLVAGTLSYLGNAREKVEIKQLVEEIKNNIPDYEEYVMTYAEELRREGEQKGKQEEKQEIARNLLKSGVDTSIVAKATHLTIKQLEELKKTLR